MRSKSNDLLVDILQLSLAFLKRKLEDGSITPSELATAQKLLQQNRVTVDDLPQPGDNLLESEELARLPFSGVHVSERE